MTSSAIQHEALTRAVSGQSTANYQSIFDGFMQKGIALEDIQPRVNVFTFWAWKGLGRRVKKGEHGVKACTFVPVKGNAEATTDGDPHETGTCGGFKMPRTVTVFHISQTEPELGYVAPTRRNVVAEVFRERHAAPCWTPETGWTDDAEADAPEGIREHFQA